MKKLINSMIENKDIYQTSLLTRCYTQHALRLYIDSETNHIRHSIKIPFINKGIEFIDLPSILRDNTVESSIPDYFENKEPPLICYKYNQSRTNGPIIAHLTITQAKNKRHCCKSFVKISAVACQ